MKRWNILLLALLICLPVGGLAEDMTDLFAAAAGGMGEGIEMGAAAALAGMDQDLTLSLQTENARIEEGKSIRLTVTAGNPRPVDTAVAISLKLPQRLSASPDDSWKAVLPAAKLDAQTGQLVPSVTSFTREILLAPGGASEETMLEAEMHMGTRFYRAQTPLALCVPDISIEAGLLNVEDGRVTPGDAYGYEIVITNRGTAPKDVAVELKLPASVSLSGEPGPSFMMNEGVLQGIVRAEAAMTDAAGTSPGSVVMNFPVKVDDDALDGEEDALRLLSGSLYVDGERVALPRLQLCGPKISARMLLDEQEIAVGEQTRLRLVVVNGGLAEADVRLSCVLPEGIALTAGDGEDEQKIGRVATPGEAALPSGGDGDAFLQAQMITGEGETSVMASAQDDALVFDLHMPAAKRTDSGIVASTHVIELPVYAREMQTGEDALMGAALAWSVDDGRTQLGDAAAMRVYQAKFLGIAPEEWSAVFFAGLLMVITLSCLCAAVRARGKEEDFCCE